MMQGPDANNQRPTPALERVTSCGRYGWAGANSDVLTQFLDAPICYISSVMKPLLQKGIVLLAHCFLMSGCLIKTPYRSHIQLPSKTDETQLFIEIVLEKPGFWLSEYDGNMKIKHTKNYMLAIDFHTKDVKYKCLDSIYYEISNEAKQAISSGTLPILNGKLSRRSYSPEVHRTQCTTAPDVVFGKQRGDLTSNFIIYGTDVNNQPVAIAMNNRTLTDHKFSIGRLF